MATYINFVQRYFIQISYNGTSYHGWQIQENTPKTVQQTLNDALSIILNEIIETVGCGRTDTGVHAKNYYAHFDTTKLDLHLDEKLMYKLNSFLPSDIAVKNIYKIKKDANSRFDAVSRTYEYVITHKKDPFLIHSAYHNSIELDVVKMNEACKILFEYADFTSFCKSKTQTFTNNCKIMIAKWEQKNELLIFTIKADRFLRNMVRAIVGTMIDIGKGKLSIEDFKNIIESKNRSEAGFSVPACGLFLMNVEYPENYFNEQS